MPKYICSRQKGRKKFGLGIKKGWDVTAFDFIPHAREKRVGLAKSQRPKISYDLVSVLDSNMDKKINA